MKINSSASVCRSSKIRSPWTRGSPFMGWVLLHIIWCPLTASSDKNSAVFEFVKFWKVKSCVSDICFVAFWSHLAFLISLQPFYFLLQTYCDSNYSDCPVKKTSTNNAVERRLTEYYLQWRFIYKTCFKIAKSFWASIVAKRNF